MQPVSIKIEGEFWDSQIYSGELILIDRNGPTHRIAWSQVVDQLAESNRETQTAIRVAFSDSDLFYTPKVRKILRDPNIEAPIKRQLKSLANLDVIANSARWSRHWRTMDSPFDFLPTDTDIYYNTILAAGNEGLFSAPRGTSGSQSASGRSSRHHDGPVLQVKASTRNTAVAAAGGADGLFEFPFISTGDRGLDKRRRLAKIPCSACDWAFQSILAWNNQSAFMASFSEEKEARSNRKFRKFQRVLRQEQILSGQDISDPHSRVWGSHEKVFCLSESGIEVLDYQQSRPEWKNPGQKETNAKATFSKRGKVGIPFEAASIIATGTAPFGSVIELEDEIVVMRSDGVIARFPGAAVHWRVFPRSEHYSNQLHIIYEDYLQIVSFMHDYFVEQNKKLMGFVRGTDEFLLSVGGLN